MVYTNSWRSQNSERLIRFIVGGILLLGFSALTIFIIHARSLPTQQAENVPTGQEVVNSPTITPRPTTESGNTDDTSSTTDTAPLVATGSSDILFTMFSLGLVTAGMCYKYQSQRLL